MEAARAGLQINLPLWSGRSARRIQLLAGRARQREGEVLCVASPVLDRGSLSTVGGMREGTRVVQLAGNEVSDTGSGEPVFIASTGTPMLSPTRYSISLSDQHFILLGFIVCVAAGTLSCLFLAAIPTLLAFKKAAESLEKLADAAREELPGTMAAVRLSGMEISDLTMELSDLGQEISEGVRSSARAVRAAEDGLRRIGSVASKAPRSPNKGGGGSPSASLRNQEHAAECCTDSCTAAQLSNHQPAL